MGRKLESLRRGDSRESLNVTPSTPPPPPHPTTSSGETVRKRSPWRIGRSASESLSPPPCRSTAINDTESTRRRALSDVTEHSPSPLKSFFIRMGSTGMLNGSKHHTPPSCSPKERAMPYNPDLPGGKVLFKSCSTSQLSTSYVKGEDPADGLDLSLQCIKKRVPSVEADPSYVPTKTRSCDNIASLGTNTTQPSTAPSIGGNRRANFPYAFLRSKLSVLPEENGGSVVNQQSRRRVSNKESFPEHRRRKDNPDVKSIRRYNYSFPQSFTAVPYQSSIGEEYPLVQKSGQPSYYVSSNESGYDSDGPRHGEESICKVGSSEKCLNTTLDQDGDTEHSGQDTAHRNSSGAVELGSISTKSTEVQNESPEVIDNYRRLPGASSLTSLHDRHNRDLYRRRFILVRIAKTKGADLLGIHLVQQTQPIDTNRNPSAVRFYISKLDPESLAARYDLTLSCLVLSSDV
ncbi:hypothetical protein B7P43_G12356 [Cryptotermes secundus]|uniref:Uncharacterized protein n=1 Tax=Cryptotermes secundus TaxID=105785 RepID=A0A2J7R7E0_9NEOP|nr:hypothetical protein B7P43_G12356 [Cryptotermes secundus]